MLDRIFVPPFVHFAWGGFLLLVASLTMLILAVLAWKKRPMTTLAHGAMALTQFVLLVQIALGIKLLDQNLGTMQLYIHYLGGLAPIGAFLGMRYLPKFNENQSRIAAGVMLFSLFSLVLTMTLGGAFVRGEL